MTESMKYRDDNWTEEEWRALLENIIHEGLLSWQEVTALTLGHMNPSQVGTSLASSEGFKRKYGKGRVMSLVMEWFYEQEGKCYDCGTRLELQADHNLSREQYDDPLDADFIENMVLRCRRCNVVRRPSHEFGGKTHLTTESALMWILFSFRPRTLPDFVRMCRLYGMTMADVRMQEGWAMAHWLRRVKTDQYVIDTDETECQILMWPDSGITRCWQNDEVVQKAKAQILFNDALPAQHILLLAYFALENSNKLRVQCFRYRIGNLPFSHYFPEDGAESLAITYTPPKRRKTRLSAKTNFRSDKEGAIQEGLALEQMGKEAESIEPEEVKTFSENAKINPLPPRGMKFLAAKLIPENIDASINWVKRGKSRTLKITAQSRGRKVDDITSTDLSQLNFTIQ